MKKKYPVMDHDNVGKSSTKGSTSPKEIELGTDGGGNNAKVVLRRAQGRGNQIVVHISQFRFTHCLINGRGCILTGTRKKKAIVSGEQFKKWGTVMVVKVVENSNQF